MAAKKLIALCGHGRELHNSNNSLTLSSFSLSSKKFYSLKICFVRHEQRYRENSLHEDQLP